MKRYEFKGTMAKYDMIVGLSFPAIIMVPILLLQLAVYYLGLGPLFKEHIFRLLMFVIVSLSFMASCYVAKKVQEHFVKNYVAELTGREIKIFEDGKEIISGFVDACEANHRESIGRASFAEVSIYIGLDKFVFRLRGKEYKNLAGVSHSNPLGTGDASDMEAILSLDREINRKIWEEERATEERP